MHRIIASLKSTMRTLGWVDGLTYLLAQAISRLTRGHVRIISYDLVVQPMSDGLDLPAHRGKDIEILEIVAGDPLLAAMDRPAEILEARFEQGARCLVALKKGELAGFLWWTQGPYTEDEVRCVFIPEPHGQAIWDFDVYVAPRYRFSPIFPCLWNRATKQLFAQGYRYSCSRISAFNPASLAAHRRLGAEVVGRRLFICLGRLQLSFSRQSPRCHISLKARPNIKVSRLAWGSTS